jgi:hypothetical protein
MECSKGERRLIVFAADMESFCARAVKSSGFNEQFAKRERWEEDECRERAAAEGKAASAKGRMIKLQTGYQKVHALRVIICRQERKSLLRKLDDAHDVNDVLDEKPVLSFLSGTEKKSQGKNG